MAHTETGTDHRNGNRHRHGSRTQKWSTETETGTEIEKSIPRRPNKNKPHKTTRARSFPIEPDSGEARDAHASNSRLLRDVHEQIDKLDRVTPLVVVPGHEFDEGRAELNASLGVEDGRAGIPEEVSRDDVVFGVAENFGASTRRRCAPPTSSKAMLGRLRRPARGGKEVVQAREFESFRVRQGPVASN